MSTHKQMSSIAVAYLAMRVQWWDKASGRQLSSGETGAYELRQVTRNKAGYERQKHDSERD